MIWSKILFFSVIIILNSCVRFKVDYLSMEKIADFPIGNQRNQVSYSKSSKLIHSVPERVGILDDFIILSEPSRFTIKIFENGKLISRIGSAIYIKKPEEGLHLIENLEVPGRVVIGQDKTFFVESFSSGSVKSGSGLLKIIHFNMKGKLLQVIGRAAKAELPFSNILWFDTDSDGLLWILYRSFGILYLEAHKNSKLIYSYTEKQCKSILFVNPVSDQEIAECELMFPTFNKNSVMMVGRVDQTLGNSAYRFQYRKIIIQELKSGKRKEVFKKLNDPDYIPYLPFNNQILFWQTQSYRKARLAVYDLEGYLVNNLQIDFPGRYYEWRSTFLTLSGKLYSQRIYDNRLFIYEWK